MDIGSNRRSNVTGNLSSRENALGQKLIWVDRTLRDNRIIKELYIDVDVPGHGQQHLLYTINPRMTPTTMRAYFYVDCICGDDAALGQHGTHFETMETAVAWCEAHATFHAPTSQPHATAPSNGKPTPQPFAAPVSPADSVGGPVLHPKHYNMGKYEVIDVLEDWKLGPLEFNVVKYIARARHKGKELEDLKKARFYLDRRITQLEKLEAAAQKLVSP
jgi:hypothetical protein